MNFRSFIQGSKYQVKPNFGLADCIATGCLTSISGSLSFTSLVVQEARALGGEVGVTAFESFVCFRADSGASRGCCSLTEMSVSKPFMEILNA